ncbi:MAG TPA: DNA polymerase IV [Actinomycetota bacterium]|nr:DNA polymerase IV [Actinomycetota bacterium]
MSESILHVDMDAFYASVETIKDPSLRGRPVIVGGVGGRGVVTSASYEARAFGVRSAMPIVTARRMCPHGVFVANDFDAYLDLSTRIREVFTSFTPLVEPMSLDEAFLDVSGSIRLFGPPREIAELIKRRIAAMGLACTVGVAPNKFIAKIASARAKPDGLMVVTADAVEGFLHPLPVGALWGVGEHTAEALRRLGLRTVGDVARVSRRTLERALGDAMGAHLHGLARGVDERPVRPYEAPKSVGCENTFSVDLDSTELVLREVLRLSDRVASRLRSKGLCGRTVTLKVRYANFKTITRSKTLIEEIDAAAEIYAVARSLYASLSSDKARIRLLGVSLSGLSPGPPRRQLDLLATRPPRTAAASAAIDAIRERFGDDAVTPGTLVEEPH